MYMYVGLGGQGEGMGGGGGLLLAPREASQPTGEYISYSALFIRVDIGSQGRGIVAGPLLILEFLIGCQPGVPDVIAYIVCVHKIRSISHCYSCH